MVVSLRGIQTGIPWPVIMVVRDLSFRWLELLLKGEKSLFLQCRVERGASVGPSKALGQKIRHTHIYATHRQPHGTMTQAVPSHKDIDRMQTRRDRNIAQIKIHENILGKSHLSCINTQLIWLLKHKAQRKMSLNPSLSAENPSLKINTFSGEKLTSLY